MKGALFWSKVPLKFMLPPTEMFPAKVEVAVVEVAVKYPKVGDPVAAKFPDEVQYVIMLAEPEPVSPEPRFKQLPPTA